MAFLTELAKALTERFAARARRLFKASLFVKVVLVCGGSLLVAGAQYAAIPSNGPATWNIVGIAAAIIVFVGTVYVAITEQDASQELALAQKAVSEAQEAGDLIEVIDSYDNDLSRAVELYTAVDRMRQAVIESMSTPPKTEADMIESLLKVSDRSLMIALGFRIEDHWTLGVYRAEQDAPSRATKLRCLVNRRSIPCDISDARVWPDGVGAAGVAFAKSGECIVPDLGADGLGSAFDLGPLAKREDKLLYRSIIAVTVKTGSKELQSRWGVVVATSNRAGHFYVDEESGVHTAEAVRAFAGMIELALHTFNSLLANRSKTQSIS